MQGVELGVIVISTIMALAFVRLALSIIVSVTWYAVRPLALALVIVANVVWWIARTCFRIAVAANRAFHRRAGNVRSAARATLRDSSGASAQSARPMRHASTG